MNFVTFLEGLALSLSILAAASIVYYTLRYGISPMPSSRAVRQEIMEILPVLDSGEVFELGSGFGTLAIPLARHYPNLQITGFEISPLPCWIARLRARLLGLHNVHFIRRDFLSEDLSRPQLLVSYLYPGGMKKIAETLQSRAAAPQYFLSHTFALPGHEPTEKRVATDIYRSPIYLYKLGTHPKRQSSGEA